MEIITTFVTIAVVNSRNSTSRGHQASPDDIIGITESRVIPHYDVPRADLLQ